MLNVVALMGRLVYEPELKTTPNGINVCSFRIACDRNFARQGEQRQADFIDVTAWRQTAELVCSSSYEGQHDRSRRQLADPSVPGQERQQPHSYRGYCVAGKLLRRKGRREARCARFRPADRKSCARSETTASQGGRRSLRAYRSIRRAAQTTFRSSTIRRDLPF